MSFSAGVCSVQSQHPARAARGRTLFEGHGLSVRLSWYGPGLRMTPHAHARHQLSLLLAGTLGESGAGDEVRLDVPAMGVKPAGLVHANDYGPAGALIFAIEMDACMDLRREIGLTPVWRWREQPPALLLQQVRSLLDGLFGGKEADAEGRLWELMSSLADSQGIERRMQDLDRRMPPRWVGRVRARLHEESTPLAELARDEGLHPVYLSRAFSRWTGYLPSAFRARSRFQRALAALSDGQSLSDAALQAGFADQAHFSRAARQHSGLSPRQLRAFVI